MNRYEKLVVALLGVMAATLLVMAGCLLYLALHLNCYPCSCTCTTSIEAQKPATPVVVAQQCPPVPASKPVRKHHRAYHKVVTKKSVSATVAVFVPAPQPPPPEAPKPPAVEEKRVPPPAPAPTVSITANRHSEGITIPYNTGVTISWSSTNASTCSISPAGWTGTSGNQNTGNLTVSDAYTLSCFGAGGSASATVLVNVLAQPPPPPPPPPAPPEAPKPPVVKQHSDWIDCREPQALQQSTCQPTEGQVRSFLSSGKTNLTFSEAMADEGLKNFMCQIYSSPPH